MGEGGGEAEVNKVNPLLATAMAGGGFAARAIDEDAAHGLGGGAKEMGAAIKLGRGAAGEAEPGFVNKRGGLERLAGGFAGHFGGGQFAQFLVNEGQEGIGALGFATVDGLEQAGDFAHGVGMEAASRARRTVMVWSLQSGAERLQSFSETPGSARWPSLRWAMARIRRACFCWL